MFETGARAYVYQIYGVHFCLNVVTGTKDYPAAVLLRAATAPEPDVSASGPGRLCRAFRVDRGLDGVSLLGRELWLEAGRPYRDGEVARTPRIGVDYAGEWARADYRFIVRGHPEVSGPRRLNG